jgi:membrane-bound lytic murein transglycosylase D
MLKNSLAYLFISIILISNCSHPAKKKSFANPVQNKPTHLRRAYLNFEEGKKYVFKGDVQNSYYYFDRAIDILLDSEYKSNLNQENLLFYINEISEIELSYLKENNADNQIEKETFLKEVISTPLFKPSKKEIKQLKKRIIRKKPVYSIPLVVNSRVVAFLKAFQNIRFKSIQNALNRSQEYIDFFKKVFREKGLPEDLAYLPIIESGFRVKATSRARAKGIFQFMAFTAKMFGLKVNWVVDERLDPFKAAFAAAKYLKCLYEEFGDWFLALACYNGGTRRVNRAIRRLKTRDFFKIARTRYLRRETRNYIPAFLASLIIAKSPGEFGFLLDSPREIFGQSKIIKIPSPVDLKEVAKIANISYSRLKELNPELIRHFTPFNKQYYSIRIPEYIDETVLHQLKRLPPEKKYFVGWYRVKKGDSLYKIARKFGTSVRKIKRTNKLTSNLIKPGKRLLIPRG